MFGAQPVNRQGIGQQVLLMEHLPSIVTPEVHQRINQLPHLLLQLHLHLLIRQLPINRIQHKQLPLRIVLLYELYI